MKRTLMVLSMGALAATGGTVFAGTSFPGPPPSPGTPITVARETFTAATTFLLPGSPVSDVHRTLTVVPQNGIDYTLEVNLGSTIDYFAPGYPTSETIEQTGVQFVPNPTFASVIVTATPDVANPGCVLVAPPTLVIASATQYRWTMQFMGCTHFPTLNVAWSSAGPAPPAGNVDVTDLRASGSNIQSGVPIDMQIRFLDTNTLFPFPPDNGNDTFVWITSAFASCATLTTTTATIDVATGRTNFVPTAPDDLDDDNGAGVTITNTAGLYSWTGPRNATFDPAGPNPGFYRFTFTSSDRDFSGLAAPHTPSIGAADSTGSTTTRTASLTNAASAAGGFFPIRTRVNGSQAQSPGSFQVTVTYNSGACATNTCTGTVQHQITFGSCQTSTTPTPATYTTWSLNGTNLFAQFANGNTNSFRQRFYVCAPHSPVTATSYEVIIYTLPVDGSTGTTLASFTVAATINPSGCINIRLEDLLALAGVSTPYLTDGGNLAVEFFFPVPNAVGVTQCTSLLDESGNPSPEAHSVVTVPMTRLNRQAHILGFSGNIALDPGL
jgi:hypothetical protein